MSAIAHLSSVLVAVNTVSTTRTESCRQSVDMFI